jgi:hypothetical protein
MMMKGEENEEMKTRCELREKGYPSEQKKM